MKVIFNTGSATTYNMSEKAEKLIKEKFETHFKSLKLNMVKLESDNRGIKPYSKFILEIPAKEYMNDLMLYYNTKDFVQDVKDNYEFGFRNIEIKDSEIIEDKTTVKWQAVDYVWEDRIKLLKDIVSDEILNACLSSESKLSAKFGPAYKARQKAIAERIKFLKQMHIVKIFDTRFFVEIDEHSTRVSIEYVCDNEGHRALSTVHSMWSRK